MKTEKLFI